MSKVQVQTANDGEKGGLPIFQKIEEKFERARRRAYELFEHRGGGDGQDWEDWLLAEKEVFGEASVNFEEKAGQSEIHMALAGFDPKDVKVTATPTEIAVHAWHEGNHDHQHTSCEVVRRFELKKPIRPDQVTAKFAHGVLDIVAPAAEQTKTAGSQNVTVAVA